MTQRALADKLGLSPQYLNAVLKGRKGCSVLLALEIDAATEGRIKAADLNGDVEEVTQLVRKLYG